VIPSTAKTLRLILGDQLNHQHSWFQQVDESICYIMMEIRSESDYASHHIQKVLGFFASMRNFAEELRGLGHHLEYIRIQDPGNAQRFDENCNQLINAHGFTRFEYMQADEFRVNAHLEDFVGKLTIEHTRFESEHFYSSPEEFQAIFKGKKTYLMETFYRHMRKKHRLMVDAEGQPWLGQWNFDKDNREKLPKNHRPPAPFVFINDLRDIESEIKEAGIKTIGFVESGQFMWPISRAQSLSLLDYFLEHCLCFFGRFQDAMAPGEWSLYHARISFSMNLKLISPREVVDQAIETYKNSKGKVTYSQLEGFVRQILGWREYMRAIYFLEMPRFAQLNYFNHKNPLPEWFWTGKTKLNCLKHTIQQSLQVGYAHHIQRLMVTGNFALLAGVDPDEVDAWYLGIYIDAIEWVEMTNTRGMSQFADGGIVGTKPYVSSAAYMKKMGSYCSSCFYDANQKIGPKACPFNSLYWHFFDKHEGLLGNNPRIGMVYPMWKKMNPEVKAGILKQARFYLERIHAL
jgi:deoxyribodipyrimidine photolyase-related protein